MSTEERRVNPAKPVLSTRPQTEFTNISELLRRKPGAAGRVVSKCLEDSGGQCLGLKGAIFVT